jgi:hypothetical protein
MKTILTNGALSAITEIISLEGWAKGYKLMFQAGRVLVEVLPPVNAPILMANSTKADVEAFRAWQTETAPEFELSDADAQMCRECFTKLSEGERLRPSRWTYEIQKAIGLTA